MRHGFGLATGLLTFAFFCSTVNAHLMCQSLGIKYRDANKAYQDAKKAHADHVLAMAGVEAGKAGAEKMSKGPKPKGSPLLWIAPSSAQRKRRKLDREKKQKARAVVTARNNYQYCEREHKKLHITFPENEQKYHLV